MKTLESIREEIWEEMLRLEDKRIDQWADIRYQTLREVLQKLGHLDEPEVLSQEWINEHAKAVTYDGIPDQTEIVYVDDLQNLLVPKQEEVEEGRVRLIVGFDGGTESYYATDIGDALDFLTDYDARFTVSKEPIIPKFIADYIQEGKDLGCDLGTAMTVQTETLKDIRDYIKNNEEKFARAWLDGYTVEEEQRYVVIVKGKSSWRGDNGIFLFKENGNIYVGDNLSAHEPNEEKYQLTEQEIKDYDERFWPFAVKVEELEE